MAAKPQIQFFRFALKSPLTDSIGHTRDSTLTLWRGAPMFYRVHTPTSGTVTSDSLGPTIWIIFRAASAACSIHT